MKEEMPEEKQSLIQTGNSGEVYYSKEHAKLRIQSALGEIECKQCHKATAFEQVRWNDKVKAYICLGCIAKGNQGH